MGLSETYGDIVKFGVGAETGILLPQPEQIEHLLMKHAKNNTKDTPGFAVLKTILGEGLVTSEGPLWKRQRKII